MSRRTVLVTGAARGIGAAVARRLATEGAQVVAVDRCADDTAIDYPLATRAQLDAVVAECANGSLGVTADVGDRAGLTEAIDESLVQLGVGCFDAVVCAAGVIWGGSAVWETPPVVWSAIHRTNTEGVLNTAAATIPPMLSAGVPGRFVVVASAAASRGLSQMGAYAASKAAVVSLVRSMAADLGGSGITANAVAPGSTDTDVLAASAAVYGLDSPQGFSGHHTAERLVEPAEVADAVAWLCSEGASGVTGSVLAVDAGMTAT